MDSLSQWLTYLESIHPMSIDMGLERVKSVADRLSFNWDNTTVITVGGTNGKGTTCRFLEHYLVATGKTVATFSSPHLIDYRERITLNGAIRDEQEYVLAFEQVEAARGDITLTYFEFGTLAAFVMMQAWKPDFALLEVGLGGRLDATNIIDNDCAVITTIGLDHQEYLGNTRDAVATEKAGIIRSHSPVIIGELDPPSSLLQIIKQKGEQAKVANKDFGFTDVSNNDSSQKIWNWGTPNGMINHLPWPNIPIQNASTALAVLSTLNIYLDVEQVANTCRDARLTGRQQIINASPFVMVDVAHNPQGAQNLVNIIKQHSQSNCTQSNCVRLVVGMLKDKDIESTLSCLREISANWYLADTKGSRGCSASRLQEVVENQSTITDANVNSNITSIETFPNVTAAYKEALASSSALDNIFVFGSFLTVADVLAYDKRITASRSIG